METYIHLIRHGITEGNQKRWYYGDSDIPLADEGIKAIKELVEDDIYPRPKDACFFTSGMLRTEQTFKLIYGNKTHKKIKALEEMKFGDFEKKTHDELCNTEEYHRWMDDATKTTPPPGGESVMSFRKRVNAGFDNLLELHKKKQRDFVVVCHGGVIGNILGYVFPKERDNMFQWIPHPARGYSLKVKDGQICGYESI